MKSDDDTIRYDTIRRTNVCAGSRLMDVTVSKQVNHFEDGWESL